jgi:putative nucleotidyltransferase with HDIG domain
MNWNINTLISLFAIVMYSTLFCVVTIAKPQTHERKTFRYYLLSMMFWSFSALMVFKGGMDALFWFKFMIPSGLASLVFMFNFVQVVTSRKVTWARYIYFFTVAMTLLSILTDATVQSVYVENGFITHYDLGPFMFLIAVPSYGLSIIYLSMLRKSYVSTSDMEQRNRLRYLIIGMLVIFIGSLVNFTPLGKYPIDIASNGLAALIIAYSILKHKLLDISVVIRKGLIYSIPTTMIGAFYFLIITFTFNLFHALTGIQLFLLSLVVAIITALFLRPFLDRAQTWIDRLFYREKYDWGQMLERLSRTTVSVLDLDRLSNLILEEVTSTLHIKNAALFLKEKESNTFALMAYKGNVPKPNIWLEVSHPLITWLSNHNEPLAMTDLEVMPQFKSLWGKEKDDLERINGKVFIPLQVQNNLVGIFAFGERLSEQPYALEDFRYLTAMANQTAVAIENARLYDLEQSQRKELDELYNLTAQLVNANDTNEILTRTALKTLEIVNVTYIRMLTYEEVGTFICRAAYHIRGSYPELCSDIPESFSIQSIYQKVVRQAAPRVFLRDSKNVNSEELQNLFFDGAATVCIAPLIAGDACMGIMVLGESRNVSREPFSNEKIRLINTITNQTASALQRALLHEQMEDNFVQTVLALANTMDARDTYTSGHSQSLADLAIATGMKLNMDNETLQSMRWGALLHDIGKIGVPDEILRKPGPLTKKEWEEMKKHPLIGANIVQPVKKLANVAPIIRSHHEWFDGNGYPFGLKGEQIPLPARILTVVDSFSAMIDTRIYRKGRSVEEAIIELKRCSGKQFDPVVVEAFLDSLNQLNFSH